MAATKVGSVDLSSPDAYPGPDITRQKVMAKMPIQLNKGLLWKIRDKTKPPIPLNMSFRIEPHLLFGR